MLVELILLLLPAADNFLKSHDTTSSAVKVLSASNVSFLTPLFGNIALIVVQWMRCCNVQLVFNSPKAFVWPGVDSFIRLFIIRKSY